MDEISTKSPQKKTPSKGNQTRIGNTTRKNHSKTCQSLTAKGDILNGEITKAREELALWMLDINLRVGRLNSGLNWWKNKGRTQLQTGNTLDQPNNHVSSPILVSRKLLTLGLPGLLDRAQSSMPTD